jgi:hypothetical protein
MSYALLFGVLSLIAWAVALSMEPHTGSIHLLLGIGTTLLVRWWALRG